MNQFSIEVNRDNIIATRNQIKLQFVRPGRSIKSEEKYNL